MKKKSVNLTTKKELLEYLISKGSRLDENGNLHIVIESRGIITKDFLDRNLYIEEQILYTLESIRASSNDFIRRMIEGIMSVKDLKYLTEEDIDTIQAKRIYDFTK